MLELRRYEKTHPWLTFSVDLRRAPHTLWMLLGEAKSLCEQLAGVPLKPATAEYLHQVFIAKGVQGTTAIEGNTLTEEEVRARIAKQLELPLSKEYLGREIDNIVFACNEIWHKRFERELTVETLCTFNRMVLDGLSLPPEVVPGARRKHKLGVAHYKPPEPEDCDFLVEKYRQWIKELRDSVTEDQLIQMSILFAVVAHLYFVWIHPFGDGNGRTARLIEFSILLGAGIPTPAAHLLSNFYNSTRTEYYRQLDIASSTGNPNDFITYAVRGIVDQLKEQILIVRKQQIDVAWVNYVHERFQGHSTPKHDRRRKLILALSYSEDPVRPRDIANLTPELAAAYAKKTRKTLTRDLNAVVDLGLVERINGGYRAKRELVQAFLPLSRHE